MQTEAPEQVQSAAEPQFLLDWSAADDHKRWVEAGAGSLVLHAVAAAIALYIVSLPPTPVRTQEFVIEAKRVTPLIAPPMQLTQKAPNRAPVSKEFNLESLKSSQSNPRMPSPGSLERKANVKQFKAPVPGKSPVPTPQVPDAPAIDAAKLRASGPTPPPLGMPNVTEPKIVPEEKPKIALENPGQQTGTSQSSGVARIPLPNTSVREAIRGAARGGGQGMTVGDDAESSIVLPTPHSSATPGNVGSKVQLLSDPMGIDFSPYLIKVLTAVRKNWYAVIPESARLGQGGQVIIQFAVNRDGSVPKLVISMPSGSEALDRAAVAGISASNPFPPLPSEFRGGQVRLQLSFKYKVAER